MNGHAAVAELEDAPDLESGGGPFTGSAPCGFKPRPPHSLIEYLALGL
jgi:hypothetical protein